VALVVLPLFALANTAIVFESGWDKGLLDPGSIGIFAGLIIGKPLGIFSFCFLAIGMGVGSLSKDIKWKHLLGIGFLAGIGFTMSIFITLLAYSDPVLITESKISILLASLISGIIGYSWLKSSLKKSEKSLAAPIKNIY
jgi:NhaA family Na+:H+ antiporter